MAAPYSDNMYSALDDEDDVITNPSAENLHEGLYDDALSPTDGYFGDGAYASGPGQEQLVEDPSLRQREEAEREGKRSEAERERSLNASDTTQAQQTAPSTHEHTSTARTHRRRSVEDEEDLYAPAQSTPTQQHTTTIPHERSPLFQQQHIDAPPAYTPPERSPVSPQGAQSGYQTFGAPPETSGMGVPEEQQHLLPGREPESMGGRSSGGNDGEWGRPKGFRQKLKTGLGVLLVLSVLAILISGFTWSDGHSNKKLPPGSDHEDRDREDGNPDPSDPTDPAMGEGKMRWSHSGQCHVPPHYSYMQAAYGVTYISSKSLVVNQRIRDEPAQVGGRAPLVKGEVILRPADSDHPGGDFMMEFMTNDDDWYQGVQLAVDEKGQEWDLSVPRQVDWKFKGQPCIQVRLTFWVPDNASIDNLRISTTQLNIDVVRGVRVNVDDLLELETKSGNINLPKRNVNKEGEKEPYTLAKRNTVIRTISGDVKGWLPLYDLLKIVTASGDVDVDVSPKPIDSSDPAPAKLDVDTLSGKILVREPVNLALKSDRPDKEYIPPRDYKVKLQSKSGDIQADVAVTSELYVECTSGDVRLKVWPVVDALKNGMLSMKTNTKSGDVSAEVLDPLMTGMTASGHPHASGSGRAKSTGFLRNVQSTHGTISGDVTLRYPSGWEGSLHAETISGHQNVRGKGLDLYTYRAGIMKTIDGHKGQGGSVMTVKTISGNEDVLIGK